jgi:hypothetical protein
VFELLQILNIRIQYGTTLLLVLVWLNDFLKGTITNR